MFTFLVLLIQKSRAFGFDNIRGWTRRINMGNKQSGNSEEEKRKRSEAIQRIVFPLASSTLASVAKVLVENLLFRKGV